MEGLGVGTGVDVGVRPGLIESSSLTAVVDAQESASSVLTVCLENLLR